MENRTVYVIRHGKIKLPDSQRRYIGQIDIPLSAEGVQQAQNLKRMLRSVPFSAVYSSDLQRSLQTAGIIIEGRALAPIARPELREIHLGQWEGLAFADIVKKFPEEFKARGNDIGYYRVPGGESFADCYQRVMAAFHEIMQTSSGNILLVGHAGVNRLLFCQILGMSLPNLFRINQDYGCVNILKNSSSGWQVKLMNFTAGKSYQEGL